MKNLLAFFILAFRSLVAAARENYRNCLALEAEVLALDAELAAKNRVAK